MELRWVESIMVRDLESVRREIAAFPDEASIWATPPGITNSAGTLALHLAGNIRHFIGAKLGGSDYRRDRDREFAARNVSKMDLLANLDDAITAVHNALGAGKIDVLEPFPEPVGGKFTVTNGDYLIHLATHLAFHLGQLGYLRRVVTGDASSVGAIAIPTLASAKRISEPG